MADSANNRKYALVGALVALLAVGAAWVVYEWYIAPADSHVRTAGGSLDENNDQRNVSQPLELDTPGPCANQPEPEPEKHPVEREAVKLPPLTGFRRLVLEADNALALRDNPDMPDEQLWNIASTLDQIDSRFAPYAKLAYDGHAQADDRVHFESDATRSFEDPDVASPTYKVDVAPRVAIWTRKGAKLPEPDPDPPPKEVPYTRRAQEAISTAVVTAWMQAIEQEFGKVDFGTDGLPLDIVVYPDLQAYLRFSSKRLGLQVPPWSAGYYSSRWDVISIPVLETTSFAEVIRHEMFHAVQAHRAPQSLLVPWFAEGTAEWLDKAPPGAALQTLPAFASAAFGYLRSLVAQGLKLDLKAFLAQDLEAFYTNPELNYLIAYCFVDFVRANDDLRQLYFEFWRLMCDGTDKDNAFARTFGGLDFAALLQRFLGRIQGYPKIDTPPRLSYDAPAEHFDKVPAQLSGSVVAPSKAGGISEGWYGVLGKLREKGFDTSRASLPKGDYDLLIVAVDHSETMAQTIDTPNFDFDALSRWLFSLRYAGSLQFSRKSPDGSSVEEVPPSVLLAMVDAVLTDRVEEFTQTAGVKVGEKIQNDIKTNYAKFQLSGDALKAMSKRDIARNTAESVAWYWGTRQDKANVVLVDYNLDVKTEQEKNAFKTSGYNSSSSPLTHLFGKTNGHTAPAGSNGADTDWWAALQAVVHAAQDNGASRVACMFFTDGPNSLGSYGHMESGRDDTQYMLDQEKLAIDLKYEWSNAGLDSQDQPSVLQLFALPGAEGQGLDYIPQQVTQAKLDEWKTHFLKP